jgi:hypothetical protein
MEAWVEGKRKKDKPKKKRTLPRRTRFGTTESVRLNLASISQAQGRSRARLKRATKENEDVVGEKLPIIEDISKSEQAWLNELRRVMRPEDLDDFE